MSDKLNLLLKNFLLKIGVDIGKLKGGISSWSITRTYGENGLGDLVTKLRGIVLDISHQEESEKDKFNDYLELKRRTLHAFQCHMMLKAVEGKDNSRITVVDIGDSAGTHMLYLKELTKGRFDIDTISVNLDPRAVEKIKARGLSATLCRAEELDLGHKDVDLFTSFQMVEHLHNPAIFFHRLAMHSNCKKMLITVPYLRRSRVGLHHVRRESKDTIYAEDEHIFELSPEDWTLLLLHSGWRAMDSQIYYQYPKQWPVVSWLLAWFWRENDFEGFWGAVLEKDTSLSNLYQDWED